MVIDLCIFLFSTDTYKTHKWLLFPICGNEKGFLLYLFSLFTNCKGPSIFYSMESLDILILTQLIMYNVEHHKVLKNGHKKNKELYHNQKRSHVI